MELESLDFTLRLVEHHTNAHTGLRLEVLDMLETVGGQIKREYPATYIRHRSKQELTLLIGDTATREVVAWLEEHGLP